jgi:hypothetical protein
VDAKSNTMSTEGEQEALWRHKEHDNSIITRAFFITRGSTRWVYVCMYLHICICTHTYMCMYVCVHIYVYVCIYTYLRTHIYAHDAYIKIYTYMYIYIVHSVGLILVFARTNKRHHHHLTSRESIHPMCMCPEYTNTLSLSLSHTCRRTRT